MSFKKKNYGSGEERMGSFSGSQRQNETRGRASGKSVLIQCI